MKLTIPSAGEVTNYKRTTNYQTGEVIINFTDDNGDWERRNFASRDQDIVVTLLSKSSSEHKITCSIQYEKAPGSPNTYENIVSDEFLNIRGKYPLINGNQGGYEGVTKIVNAGGTVSVNGNNVEITDTDTLVLITAVKRYKLDYSEWDNQELQTILNYHKNLLLDLISI